MEQLEFIRNAGETRRFHTWPVLRQQNVAEHSWHVTMLLWFIFGGQEPGIRMELMMAALTHDMAEWQVGDIPSPAKRAMDERLPGLKRFGGKSFRDHWGDMEQSILAEQELNWECFLTDDEKQMLKLVDSMDGAFYCIRERAMGNKLIEPCYRNFISYVEDILMASFPVNTVQHGDRKLEMEDVTGTLVARRVYQHIKDMWEQADVS